jgi:C4-type Zn-finger protein
MTQTPQAAFQQWLETAHQFDRHSAENVSCPCCGSTSLSVKDVEYGFGHDKGVQRYISCGRCGAFTGVNIKRAGEDHKVKAAGETMLSVASGRA